MGPTVLRVPQRWSSRLEANLSLLGLGTVKFGRNTGVKYPRPFDLPSDEQLDQLIGFASDIGINVIDTAPAYGLSEERLGQLLGRQRDRWFLSTKTGEEFDNGVSTHNFTAAHTRFSVLRSLRRLRTDRLDMVMVHSDGNDLDILERTDVLETLEQCRKEGLLRYIGFSGKTCAGALRALDFCDAVMVTYNLNEVDELAAIEKAAASGQGVFIKKALASGHHADPPANTDSGAIHSTERLQGDPIVESFQHILACTGVTSIVAGTINPRHLEANAKAVCTSLAQLQSQRPAS